jgi:hypothetical protein
MVNKQVRVDFRPLPSLPLSYIMKYITDITEKQYLTKKYFKKWEFFLKKSPFSEKQQFLSSYFSQKSAFLHIIPYQRNMKGWMNLKIVVLKSPKIVSPLLKKLFHVKK